MPVFLALFVPGLLWLSWLGAEDVRGRENLIKVLELLPGLQSVRVANKVAVYLCNIGKSIHYEGAH